MEPSGGLFPSLVVMGHVVTLVAVWYWRRGRWWARDEQGKRGWQQPPQRCGQPPPLLRGLEEGPGEGTASLTPAFPCSLPFLSLESSSRTWSAAPLGQILGCMAPSVWSPILGSQGRSRSGCWTGDMGSAQLLPLEARPLPSCQGQGDLR